MNGETEVCVSVSMCSVFAGGVISANLHGKVVNLRLAMEASPVELTKTAQQCMCYRGTVLFGEWLVGRLCLQC